MERDTSISSEKVRQKRGVEASRLSTDEKSKRGSVGASRGNKASTNSEGRPRNGRSRRGPRKPNGNPRALESILNPIASFKPLHKMKFESKEPSLLEAGFKVIIRRLPPTLPESVLLESIAALTSAEKYGWFKFVPGKVSDNLSKPKVHSRAYIRFIQQGDASNFIHRFNGHTFINAKGDKDKALVEFSPFSKTPKTARPDAKQGSITEDPEYLSFVESLSTEKEKAPAQPQAVAQATISEDPKSTPLLEFIRINTRVESTEARQRGKSSKPPVILLPRNGKAKAADHPKPAVQEPSKRSRDDKKSKKPKPAKPAKEAKPSLEPKVENEEPGSGRRPRRRLRKRGGAKEEGATPFTPTQILKPPSKGQDPEWPEPGIKNSGSPPADEPSPKNGKSTLEPSATGPVRTVFKVTNGCLTQSTGQNGSVDSSSKPPRTRRRRPPPATSKPQAAS